MRWESFSLINSTGDPVTVAGELENHQFSLVVVFSRYDSEPYCVCLLEGGTMKRGFSSRMTSPCYQDPSEDPTSLRETARALTLISRVAMAPLPFPGTSTTMYAAPGAASSQVYVVVDAGWWCTSGRIFFCDPYLWYDTNVPMPRTIKRRILGINLLPFVR